MMRRALARQTEIDALDPRPDPIGIADLSKKVTFAVGGVEREM